MSAPPIPDTRVHAVREIPLEAVMAHLDLRTTAFARLKAPREKRAELRRRVERVAAGGGFTLAGVYRFLLARRDGDGMVVEGEGEARPVFIPLPRTPSGWSAADALGAPGARQPVACFAVTAGDAGPQARRLEAEGKFAQAHLVELTALALAEGCADWMHGRLRAMWGIGPEEGFRISPGYPACPDLAVQRTMFALLRPEAVGITLTESMMMAPEASVSAIVFCQGRRESADHEE
jgi:5-methyltetrahydrofolate--homocysteine methyltransferase